MAAVKGIDAAESAGGQWGTVADRADPKWVLVARLVRPHGRRGELVAEILTDFPERFHDRPRLVLIPPERIASRPREMELENFWFLRSRIVMKFRGVDSINEAESLRGFAVAIPLAERAPLEAGSVYVSDLTGCRIIDLNRGGGGSGHGGGGGSRVVQYRASGGAPGRAQGGRGSSDSVREGISGAARCGQPAAWKCGCPRVCWRSTPP